MVRQLFCVSSGRAGSFLIHRLLSLYPQVESHHEYCCPHVQQAAVLHHLGLYSEAVASSKLDETHGAGVRYCEAEWFADSSNKLSWMIKPLHRLFPEAKFLWLVRDGRRVVSSFYHKLPDEVYVDRWVNAMYQWLDRYPHDFMAEAGWWLSVPPPIKAAWWVCPRPNSFIDKDIYPAFRYEWNRWQRLCWYWNEVNRTIADSLGKITALWHFARLEDLTADRDNYRGLMEWLGFGPTEQGWQLLQKPANVTEPVNYPITQEQEAQYWEICGETHLGLGYGREAVYDVKY